MLEMATKHCVRKLWNCCHPMAKITDGTVQLWITCPTMHNKLDTLTRAYLVWYMVCNWMTTFLSLETDVCITFAVFLHCKNIPDSDIWVLKGQSPVILPMTHSYILIYFIYTKSSHLLLFKSIGAFKLGLVWARFQTISLWITPMV